MTLLEEHIRPANLMERKRNCVERDRRFLLERKDRFVRVCCPACGAADTLPLFGKLGFCYERCSACGTLLMNPRPDQSLMHEFYSTSANYAFWNKHIFPATEDARRRELFRPRAERVQVLCASRGVLGGTALEVGAGFGTFCEELARLGLFDRVIALEPTPGLAATCRAKGLITVEAPVERCDVQNDSVDVAFAFEVIEHLFCPMDFIQRVARFLKPTGCVILSCPNARGFDVATLGVHSNTIDHEHVNYFHPGSMRRLLERCGLEVVEITTPGRLDAELVRKAVLESRIALDEQPFLRHVLIEEWEQLGQPFQEFLAANNLSSHMWTVAARME